MTEASAVENSIALQATVILPNESNVQASSSGAVCSQHSRLGHDTTCSAVVHNAICERTSFLHHDQPTNPCILHSALPGFAHDILHVS